MQTFIVAAALLVCGAAAASQCGVQKIAPLESPMFDRIVGGIAARKNSWPWQGHVIARINYFGFWVQEGAICGGSLVSEKWFITAAHCIMKNAESFSVRLGQHDSSVQEASAVTHKVKRVIVHPDYQKNNDFDNDIAIFELETPVKFTDEISPVCLPDANSDPAPGTPAIVTGWGEMNQNNYPGQRPPAPVANIKNNKAASSVLRQVTVNIVERSLCNSDAHYGGWALDSMVCAGRFNVDACQGDSGGPLVAKNAQDGYDLVGVVSWGFGCGDARFPGIFSRVGNFIEWINTETNNLS